MVIQILLLEKKLKACYNHFYFTSNFINRLKFSVLFYVQFKKED